MPTFIKKKEKYSTLFISLEGLIEAEYSCFVGSRYLNYQKMNGKSALGSESEEEGEEGGILEYLLPVEWWMVLGKILYLFILKMLLLCYLSFDYYKPIFFHWQAS
jgi:hypothetical protein